MAHLLLFTTGTEHICLFLFMHCIKDLDTIAVQGRAIGHECRIKIAFLLRTHGTMSLKRIAATLHMREPSASKNVQPLLRIGVVQGKRKGKCVEYSLTKKVRRSKIFWRILERGIL